MKKILHILFFFCLIALYFNMASQFDALS